MRAKPIAGRENFSPVLATLILGILLLLPALTKQIVVSETPLRDGDGVILQADLASIIQHRNPGCIKVRGIAGLPRESHVILAQLADRRSRILLRRVVPEREVAIARSKIRRGNSIVIMQPLRD